VEIPFKKEIGTAAREYGLEPALVAAICSVESSFQPGAIRFEPKFKRKYVDPHPRYRDLGEETKALLASSMGLMQTMGVVAHEDGLPISRLRDLFIPGIGLEFGCKELAQLYGRYEQSPEGLRMSDVVAAYNAGSARIGKGGKYLNQPYVDRVLKKYRELKGGKCGA
jgi:soluble lytic murein transglycosylase-like protein